MYSRETVDVRPNWERRVQVKGLDPKHWSEGSMVVVKESPVDLVNALMDYASRVPLAMNALFEESDFSKAPEFENVTQAQVFNAASSSWAHQDFALPIRFDIAVHKICGYSLLAVKGDYLEGMVSAASVCKSWHEHHFEGMPEVSEVNFLQEHLVAAMLPFGKHASPPSIRDVTVISSEPLWICGDYLKDAITQTVSGLSLSSVGIAQAEGLLQVQREEPLSSCVVKVEAWKDILSTLEVDPSTNELTEVSNSWLDLFNRPRSFTLQPPWVLALDEMVDLSEPFNDDDIYMVLNIWVDIASDRPVPLVVSSEYKPGYKFEESMITPVVLNFKAEQH